MARLVAPADSAALHGRTRRGFELRFGRAPDCMVSAPGRANLLGEHTDYNDGLVLPFAIARRTCVAATRRSDRMVRIASALEAGVVELSLDVPIAPGAPRWGDYARGVVAEFLALEGRAFDPGGFDAWIESDVPVGAGLSSSASLEVAIAGIVEELSGRRLDPERKAELCRRAEHGFAGVPCGLMDQMASLLATEDTLLLLDCRDNSWQRIPIPAGEIEIAVVDSELAHDLGEGEFAKRVDECRRAAGLLGLSSLRDATHADVTSLARMNEPLLSRRVLHVVEENARVLAAVDAIRANDWPLLGSLLDAGHASLRDLYDVSRCEMDDLVERLRLAGAIGARMTGGGFGGCAVALFPSGTDVGESLRPLFHPCAPCEGHPRQRP